MIANIGLSSKQRFKALGALDLEQVQGSGKNSLDLLFGFFAALDGTLSFVITGQAHEVFLLGFATDPVLCGRKIERVVLNLHGVSLYKLCTLVVLEIFLRTRLARICLGVQIIQSRSRRQTMLFQLIDEKIYPTYVGHLGEDFCIDTMLAVSRSWID
jgi:hypothetical protein